MKKPEARKLSFIERFWLRLKFPKIPSEDNGMITITMGEYELMKNIMDRERCYINQIHEQNHKIRDLEDIVIEKEKSIKKLAGKIGGLTAYINKEKQIKEQLLDDKLNTENINRILKKEVEIKKLEIEEKKSEIEIYKNLGKKKQINDYKKLQELKKDIDKKKGRK